MVAAVVATMLRPGSMMICVRWQCSRAAQSHVEILRDAGRLVRPGVAGAKTSAEVVDLELTECSKGRNGVRQWLSLKNL